MTLSMERAFSTAGLKDMNSLRVEGTTMSFLAPNRIAFSFPMNRAGTGVAVDRDSDSRRAIPFLTSRRDMGREMLMVGEVDGGKLTLKIVYAASGILRRVGDVLSDMKHDIEDLDDADMSTPPMDADAPHAGLNRSTIEPFLWAEIISSLREDSEISEIVWRVPSGALRHLTALTLDAHVADEPREALVFDCSDKGEVPGVRLDRRMRAEYADAQWAREGNLSLKDICGVARSSTCFGGDEACTYDGYVFARANRMCYSCATQSQVRNKFKVK